MKVVHFPKWKRMAKHEKDRWRAISVGLGGVLRHTVAWPKNERAPGGSWGLGIGQDCGGCVLIDTLLDEKVRLARFGGESIMLDQHTNYNASFILDIVDYEHYSSKGRMEIGVEVVRGNDGRIKGLMGNVMLKDALLYDSVTNEALYLWRPAFIRTSSGHSNPRIDPARVSFEVTFETLRNTLRVTQLFHVTQRSRVEGIMRRGLLPGSRAGTSGLGSVYLGWFHPRDPRNKVTGKGYQGKSAFAEAMTTPGGTDSLFNTVIAVNLDKLEGALRCDALNITELGVVLVSGPDGIPVDCFDYIHEYPEGYQRPPPGRYIKPLFAPFTSPVSSSGGTLVPPPRRRSSRLPCARRSWADPCPPRLLASR
jgi:hypothetical protein